MLWEKAKVCCQASFEKERKTKSKSIRNIKWDRIEHFKIRKFQNEQEHLKIGEFKRREPNNKFEKLPWIDHKLSQYANKISELDCKYNCEEDEG